MLVFTENLTEDEKVRALVVRRYATPNSLLQSHFYEDVHSNGEVLELAASEQTWTTKGCVRIVVFDSVADAARGLSHITERRANGDIRDMFALRSPTGSGRYGGSYALSAREIEAMFSDA